MTFSQQVNIVFEFQKTCFWSCLLEIAFRKKNIAYRYSPPFQSLQNALFLVSVALMQMSCCSDWTTAWKRRDCCRLSHSKNHALTFFKVCMRVGAPETWNRAKQYIAAPRRVPVRPVGAYFPDNDRHSVHYPLHNSTLSLSQQSWLHTPNYLLFVAEEGV